MGRQSCPTDDGFIFGTLLNRKTLNMINKIIGCLEISSRSPFFSILKRGDRWFVGMRGDREVMWLSTKIFPYNVNRTVQKNRNMAQLTIEIPDELAKRLVPFQNQISEIVARLITTSLPIEPTNKSEVPTRQALSTSPTYIEVLDFLVNRPTSEQIANFKVSERSQTRLQELLEKNRNINIMPSELVELNLYEQLDTLMTMLKVRAYATIKSQKSITNNPK